MLTPGDVEAQAPVADLSKNIFGKMFNELAYSLGRIEAGLECFLIR